MAENAIPKANSDNLEELDTSRTQENGLHSATSSEMYTGTNLELMSPNPTIPSPFNIGSSFPNVYCENPTLYADNTSRASVSLILISRPTSVIVQQPQKISRLNLDLPSPASGVNGQPQSLFVQALAKLNENSLNLAVMDHFRMTQNRTAMQKTAAKTEVSPPDSLTSAPPSYSFVLRQMAVRRRPRIVGTFIPSPSFIQHTPPPNYAAAFDIYVENPLPPPPTRVYNFGFTSMPVVCPDCGYTGMSVVTSKITLCTHLCAAVLCVLCCWICAPLPYILRSCKDVYHYCRNCRSFLGMYCPTNPENTVT